MRFDDRGVGKSKGDFNKANSADFATDAFAAMEYLANRKEIDSKRIGLAGHSEGGLIAPMVAAEHPDKTAFIVMLAGTGAKGDAIIERQTQEIGKANEHVYGPGSLSFGPEILIPAWTAIGMYAWSVPQIWLHWP